MLLGNMHLCRALLLGYPESVKFSLLRRLYNSDIHSFTEFTFVIQQMSCREMPLRAAVTAAPFRNE